MTGLLLGACFGIGLLLLGSGIGQRRRPRPLLRGVAGARPPVASYPAPTWWRSKTTVGLLGDHEAVARLQERAGFAADPGRHLLTRIAVTGLTVAAALLILLLTGAAARGGPGPAVFVVLAAAAGWLAVDWDLGRRARARGERVAERFWVAADLFALAVAGGMSPRQAMVETADHIGGDLGEELARCSADLEVGTPLPVALRAMASRLDVPTIHRFVETVVSSVERGSPVAEVARAQALDARADEHRRLMEQAGRKDVAMLVPLVFIVLPLVVVLTLFPGAMQLGMLP